jgi:hypothetical protein
VVQQAIAQVLTPIFDPTFSESMHGFRPSRNAHQAIKHVQANVSLKTAIQHGVSSKSDWHMARTSALQQALFNAWLKAQRLVSVKELWCKAQSYST